jgi:hypothetical protein
MIVAPGVKLQERWRAKVSIVAAETAKLEN